MFENILTTRIGNITHLGYVAPQYADPSLQFGTCNLVAEFIPCTEKGGSFFEITNNGDAHNECVIAYSIAGHTPEGEVGIVGEPFPLTTGETVNLEVVAHFATDYWTQDETITMTFYVGWMSGPSEVSTTDSRELQTFINAGGTTPPICSTYTDSISCTTAGCFWCDGVCQSEQCDTPSTDCEEHKTKSLCETANCFWYPYPNPIGDPSCHDQEMYMKYLPFIIVGVGGVVVLMAMMKR